MRKAAALAAAGTALALVLWRARPTTGGALVSDWLFALASVFLVAGLVETLGNLRMFTSTTWGMRVVKRVIRNEKADGESYADYRQNRRTHPDAPVLLVLAAVLAALSLAVGLCVCRMPLA